MSDKVIDLLKTRDFNIPYNLLANYKKLNITDFEFIVLIYIINDNERIYNPSKIAEFFGLQLHEALELISNLQSKNIIDIDFRKQNNVGCEYINLDSLFRKMSLLLIEKDNEVIETTIFSLFESEYGRTLSPTEVRLINNWLEAGYEENMIKEALQEAVYNGVKSFKYIDKILFNWAENGIKTSGEKAKKKPEKELFEYDWLNEK